ncbi:11245_t:CDS:2 [Ambispora leptoticha]|uniref:11245_t:CDS:1 n=1 Tax=Ambispora leptoticha TaxID=144679 RepID=A0A9N8VAE4_9GLOM|nr:11245_t:CDS:2 [Ambispora leptoticha]
MSNSDPENSPKAKVSVLITTIKPQIEESADESEENEFEEKEKESDNGYYGGYIPRMNQLVKRTSGYSQCFPQANTLDVKTVPADLVPNTKTSFTISGQFEGQFTGATRVEIDVLNKDQDWLYGFSGQGCPFSSCPYDANNGFTITVTADLKDLPKGYKIVVAIFLDYDNNRERPDACAIASDNS